MLVHVLVQFKSLLGYMGTNYGQGTAAGNIRCTGGLNGGNASCLLRKQPLTLTFFVQFPNLQNMDSNSTCLIGWLEN